MSRQRLVITAVLSGMSQSEAARRYGVSQGWVSKLMARYHGEGQAAFEPRSRRPHTSPAATPAHVTDLILQLRHSLSQAGHDAGADTICWHLHHDHHITIHRTTVHRILTPHGLVTAQPVKRPKSSYIRFEADQPNECWQSDFTHYRLTNPDDTPGADCEIITWLDDHSRTALHVSAHSRITAAIVTATFRTTADLHGYPASTLTDNGMVYTVRLAGTGRRGGRTSFEAVLHQHGIIQKNGTPNHPQTQGKVERFQQTMKHWLTAQPNQPTSLTDLQALLDTFVGYYNTQRPHRSLPHHATPAAAYQSRIKATPSGPDPAHAHDRVRHDIIDTTGAVSLRVHGKLHHIGIGRTHARTHVTMLIHDLDVTIINTATGEILRELTIDPTRNYQPRTKQK
ncbi:IS481 family transposase [Flaviflexus huanghaiensis]|uniref:IS481 family transposase n=1 Tax=Flaviflexus huanghaiensis TaxID=1111473 RepID=UPI0015F8AE36|nr:IS481 family transposase [Flaviflexus huanghaiensis]